MSQIVVRTHSNIQEIMGLVGKPLTPVDKAFAIHTHIDSTKPQEQALKSNTNQPKI
jgi:hypothetical protein